MTPSLLIVDDEQDMLQLLDAGIFDRVLAGIYNSAEVCVWYG